MVVRRKRFSLGKVEWQASRIMAGKIDRIQKQTDKIDRIQKWKNAAENVKLAASQPISHSLGFPLSVTLGFEQIKNSITTIASPSHYFVSHVSFQSTCYVYRNLNTRSALAIVHNCCLPPDSRRLVLCLMVLLFTSQRKVNNAILNHPEIVLEGHLIITHADSFRQKCS